MIYNVEMSTHDLLTLAAELIEAHEGEFCARLIRRAMRVYIPDVPITPPIYWKGKPL